jgi:hypothetical protein
MRGPPPAPPAPKSDSSDASDGGDPLPPPSQGDSPPKRHRGSDSLAEEVLPATAADDRPATSGSTVDSYYSDYGITAGENIKVSTDELGALQRALYERHTSPALVALVTFGLRTTPFQKPSLLLAAVREKLNSHNELWQELRRYLEALEPREQCSHQHVEASASMYVDELQDELTLDPRGKAKSELCMVREFMAFVVTRLQLIVDQAETFEVPLEPEQRAILAGCLRRWWDHANRYR